jgi:ABC-type dipeptide/oligopeptide/nickel transport system permease subunit
LDIANRHSIWRRLISKPSAFVALCIIGTTLLFAVFAYQLASDNAPNANNMIVELGSKKPGYTQAILLVPKPIIAASMQSSNWWSGQYNRFHYIPINQFSFEGNDLMVTHYIDEQLQDTLYFTLAQIIPASMKDRSIEEQQAFIKKERIVHRTFYLGTDRYGRDILSRLLIGSRVSIAVGLIAVMLSLSIGVFLGAIAGYFGGWVDNIVMFVINIFWSIPTLLLVFALTLTLGKGFWEIFVAIGLTMWVGAARLIRGQVLVIREMDYITAARAIGASNTRIIIKHILPNIAGPIIVIAASNFAAAILIEAGLSFLGIGIQPPQPSWGLMIKEHYNFLITQQPLAAIIPGLAIMLLVYAFNLLGNALRDVLDVKN